MKKSQIVFISILVLVIVISLYFTFFYTSGIQYSPEEAGFSYQNARALVMALGNDGIAWYCGKIDTFTDSQGNVYSQKELNELKRVLGNEQQLTDEIC